MLTMGILAVAVAPSYLEAMHRFRVEAAAKRVAADLNATRLRAIERGGMDDGETAGFYKTSNTCRYFYAPDPDHPENEYYVDLDEVPYPVDLVSAAFVSNSGSTSNSTIEFDMYGMPRVGALNKPMVSGQILLQSGNEQRQVVIDPVTGIASVQ